MKRFLFLLTTILTAFIANAGIETFNGAARDGAVSFTIGDVVYVGLGFNSNGTLKDFWKYSKEDDAWTQIADFAGDARTNAVAFTLNGKGYVGLGRSDYDLGLLYTIVRYKIV